MCHPTTSMSPLRKQLWRFGKILEYTVIHSAVLFGTTLSYAYILPVFIALLEDPENPDNEIFNYNFWPSLILSAFVAIKETALYSLFFYKYWELSDDDFDTWLNKNYTNGWKKYSAATAFTKSLLGGMSLGVTLSKAASLKYSAKNSENHSLLRSLAGAGVPLGGALYYFQTRRYYDQDHHNFNGATVMLSSFGVSLPSVTNYVMGIFLHLQDHKDKLSDQERHNAYIILAVYSALAIYYYTRMYYEFQVEKARKIDETIESCFGRLENIIRRSIISCCSESTQTMFAPIISGLDYWRRSFIIGGVVSGGLVFGMWSAWRGVAINTGWIEGENLELFPSNNTFDLCILLILGLGNLLVRHHRFDLATNKMPHNSRARGYTAIGDSPHQNHGNGTLGTA